MRGPDYNRAVPLYTRTGDAGDTSLLDGSRVRKSDPRVEAYGEVDELGAWLGLVRAELSDPVVSKGLDRIQRLLFALGARLADPGGRIAARQEKSVLAASDVRRLEQWMDEIDTEVPPLRTFVLSGGSRSGAALHVARVMCRRAERRMVALGPAAVAPVDLEYVNRLSDLLFALARLVNHRAGIVEESW